MPGKKKIDGVRRKKRKYSKALGKKDNNVIKYYDKGNEICRCSSVCPDIMCVQLTYSGTQRFTTATIDSIVLRGNSIFDPDFSGVGGQPMGHDQWSAFYRRYRVNGSKVEVSVNGNGTTESGFIIVPSNTNTTFTSHQAAREAAYALVGQLGRTDTNSSQMYEHYMTSAKMKGAAKDIVMYDSDLNAGFGSNPVIGWYWHLVMYDARGGVNTVNFTVSYKITYYVELFDRETLALS